MLDVFGPVEMWSYVPEFQVVLISEKGGAVSFQGVDVMSMLCSAAPLARSTSMVPGGVGTRTELQNPTFLDYLKKQNERTQVTTWCARARRYSPRPAC